MTSTGADLPAPVATIPMNTGAPPTVADILPGAQRVFVANHGTNTLAVINSCPEDIRRAKEV